MSDDLAQFRDTYITECYELLAEMEELLLTLDAESADKETLNAIFRCAHSIKGGAGAFGFSEITGFTHIAEFLLDAMREGKVTATPQIVDALLKSVDVIMTMVKAAQAGETLPEGYGKELADELNSYVEGGGGAISDVGQQSVAPQEDDEEEVTFYTIHFTPHPSLLETGNEPLLIIRELMGLGECSVQCSVETLPALSKLKPELCYLHWVIELESECKRADVEEVFEFVEDECDLTIDEMGGISRSKPATPQPDTSSAAAAATAPASSTSTPSAESPAPTTGEQPVEKPTSTSPVTSTIRVDLEKVDRLVNLVGELVITQSMLVAQTRDFPIDQFGDLIHGVEELSQHSRELQEAVMSVRMQPVKSIFSRMPRIVRDLSGKLGKKMRLEMVGENTEVDKTVIEQLGDPLTHMIRNSVDHGIESPEVRKAAGKPEEGEIILSAAHQGGKIIIQIKDDGGGINRERVRQIATEKGLVTPDASLSDEEIDNLIFKPGFSTAEEVTDISGRGVGMDVVKRNIESLGGTVMIKSQPGEGSCITVALPLTLAILDGMVVRVGKEQYIIPINDIIETYRPSKEEVRTIADGNDLVNIRGEFIAILYLNEVFAIPNSIQNAHEALLVLVESGMEKIGIVVDELIGQQQVVIKSLEANADPVEGISGATILGDGKVSLILDIGQLNRMVQRKERSAKTQLAMMEGGA